MPAAPSSPKADGQVDTVNVAATAVPRVVHVLSGERYDVYVGRPNARYRLPGSEFANPYRIGKHGTRDEVIARYRAYLLARPALVAAVKAELRGKTLACWCSGVPCHADVLLEIANG